MRSSTSLPLEGIRVLDLGQYISGPCAAVLLAELGADVVKVEPPEGDPFRQWDNGKLSASFIAFNRGKRSVVLDLKTDEGRARLIDIACTADVLIENFRPGVTERLRIDVATLSQHNPRLLYCSITGFGSTGPYAHLPAYDGVALGYSGLAGLLLDGDDPRLRGPALADAITGYSASLAILAALHKRGESGPGHHLEVSMLGSLVHFLASAVSKSVVDGQEVGPYTRPHGSQAFAFLTADDKALLVHLSSPPKFWEALCLVTDRQDLISDERFQSHRQRRANYEALRTELVPVFRRRERDEWLRLLHERHVPCAPVNTVGEALADEQLRHLGIIDVDDDPVLGALPRIRPPVAWDGAPLPAVGRAPLLGEHAEDFFEKCGDAPTLDGGQEQP